MSEVELGSISVGTNLSTLSYEEIRGWRKLVWERWGFPIYKNKLSISDLSPEELIIYSIYLSLDTYEAIRFLNLRTSKPQRRIWLKTHEIVSLPETEVEDETPK
jgi:hypothetical protein